MVKKVCNKKKSQFLSTDINIEDFELLEQVITDYKLGSRREGLSIVFNGFRGLPTPNKEECRYRFGDFCLKTVEKLKKTTDSYCQACLTAQKLSREDYEAKNESAQLEHEFFTLVGVSEKCLLDPISKWISALEFVDSLQFEIDKDENLKYIAELETQKATLETDNSILRQQLEEGMEALKKQNTAFESDNKTLKEQITKLKKDPLAEKCSWQSIELNKKDEEIKKLKADIEQKEDIIGKYMFLCQQSKPKG